MCKAPVSVGVISVFMKCSQIYTFFLHLLSNANRRQLDQTLEYALALRFAKKGDTV